ncbi:hypothetical protein JNUCC31_09095 [Paenibacillus sp. JNUCC31]|uniref:hypothetical protein n=1 Tax=Paenibacillus sp. JNUCC-31 TaxID=2777983 RepID=UPI00177F4388|nr:hypothetical protein [Paenibacillus sp. JNUCC-31]QOS81005.1 hypothetical protein JNUCC31_09095 [Paenibacillus sp. JNUCC-31]
MRGDKKVMPIYVKLTIFAVLFIVLLKMVGGLDEEETEQPVSTQASTPVVQAETKAPDPEPIPEPKADPEPVKPAFKWVTAEVTEENVRKALLDNVGGAFAIPLTDETFRKFVSSPDVYGERVELTINPGTFWDEKDFVKKAGGSLIAYSKILLDNPNIYEVCIDVKIDNAGGGENNAVYLSWRRDQAEKVDMDQVLDNMFGDYTIPFQLARNYRIQDDIYNELEKFSLPKEKNM